MRRDWSRIAELKRSRWADRRRRLGPAEGVRVAGEIYAQVRKARPDWPSDESRRADLRHHVALAERLRAARRR